jgi:hypothetical protein
MGGLRGEVPHDFITLPLDILRVISPIHDVEGEWVVLENNNGHLMPISAAERLLVRALLSFPQEEGLVSCPWGAPGAPG